jgi:hypothetical protein
MQDPGSESPYRVLIQCTDAWTGEARPSIDTCKESIGGLARA